MYKATIFALVLLVATCLANAQEMGAEGTGSMSSGSGSGMFEKMNQLGDRLRKHSEEAMQMQPKAYEDAMKRKAEAPERFRKMMETMRGYFTSKPQAQLQ